MIVIIKENNIRTNHILETLGVGLILETIKQFKDYTCSIFDDRFAFFQHVCDSFTTLHIENYFNKLVFFGQDFGTNCNPIQIIVSDSLGWDPRLAKMDYGGHD